MANFSQVPGLAGYQQQVALNDQQGAQQMMKLSQLMQMAQQRQGMEKGALEMDALQRQLAGRKAYMDAMAGGGVKDAQPSGPAAPYGGGYAPSVSQAFGLPASAVPTSAPVSSVDPMMAQAKRAMQAAIEARSFEALQEAQKHYLELKKMQPKYASDVRTVMIGGKPTAIQMADDGTWKLMGEGVAPADKLHFADTGGRAAVGLNPYTGAEQAPGIAKTMSPEGMAANSRGWADIATKREANQVARDVAASARTQNTEMKLADDYRVESKGFAETSTAMKKVFKALETADKNPGSALAAGTAFMKVLDPNSVVRESELGMALNASGWFDRAMNIANTLQSGRIMTKQQTANLRAAAEDLFQEAKAAQLEIDNAYASRAKSYGANPANVLIDRGQRETKKPPTGASVPVKSEADALKLPAGTRFQLPDGRTGTAR